MTENPQQPRQPGEWPVPQPADIDEHAYAGHDELYVQRAAERALHELVLDSIRHDLKQQPSPASVRTAARAWCNRITAAAEEIAKGMR
ncbi:hypothetical protein [Streptomyces sp. NPDC005302]|uniref:hypothetical protein n=1 Tax=Streptomyces sp. NPDC005302 TaxID=3154675 RepID=UPI0033A8753F